MVEVRLEVLSPWMKLLQVETPSFIVTVTMSKTTNNSFQGTALF